MSRSFLYTLLAALALPVSFLASGCAECGCEISTSSTDREARWARMREIEEYNRPFDSYADPEKAIARGVAEYKGYGERYNARFQGRIIPGMGCDVCEWACEIWDLRPMDPDDYKTLFRETTRLRLRGENREEIYIGAEENRRLMCVAEAHPERLIDALKDLMHPREHPAVRYDAIGIALSENLDREYALARLQEMAREGGRWGDDAQYKLMDIRAAEGDASVE